tara:strand:- start:2599 stop:2775 length:177 start_codon:yes stop_codon:yes gene_type:complete
MRSYTRKQINQDSDKFRKTQFYIAADVAKLIEDVAQSALAAGANEPEFMEFFKNETTD